MNLLPQVAVPSGQAKYDIHYEEEKIITIFQKTCFCHIPHFIIVAQNVQHTSRKLVHPRTIKF